jgi:hypothetical protein
MAQEDWQTLRIGDRIRFVSMPTGFSRNNCHEETLEAYRTLIARRRLVRVYKLDEFNMPWIQFRVQQSDGRWDVSAPRTAS